MAGHSLGGLVAPRVADRLDGVARTEYLIELDGTVTPEEQARLEAVRAAAGRVERLALDDGELVLGAGRPYWESLREYDAFATARSLDVPILVCHGGRDCQVTETDIESWREALASEAAVRFETYPELNHLFVPGEGPASPAEYQTEGHVAEQVVTDIDAWLEARWS